MEFAYEIQYLQAGTEELEAYLLSDDLFWPIHAAPPAGMQPYPRLTLGGLSLAQKRAGALIKSREEAWQVEQIIRRIDIARQKWRLRWDDKAHRELMSRLMQWRNYLQEYRQDPVRHAAYYPYEIRWRVLIELLEKNVEAVSENENELRTGLDLILKSVFKPGEFVWDKELQPAFAEDAYWYLYGRPGTGNSFDSQ